MQFLIVSWNMDIAHFNLSLNLLKQFKIIYVRKLTCHHVFPGSFLNLNSLQMFLDFSLWEMYGSCCATGIKRE